MNATIERFLSYLSNEQNCSRHTVSAYRRDVEQFESFLRVAGECEPDFVSVEPVDIRAWVSGLARSGMGQSTIRRKVQSVRALFRYLMRCGTVTDNPAADLELAKLPKRLPAFVREGQLNALLDSEVEMDDFEQVRDRLMVMMLYETGIRRSELATMADESVDTQVQELRVRGKRDKDRIVPFGDELKGWIDRYRALRRKVAADGKTFFTRQNGKPLYPSLIYKVVTSQLGQAGVTGKKSPHVLRHSFATSMLNAGAGLDSVKDLLGHESIATTQVYTHVTMSDLINNYKLAHPRAQKKGG